MGVKRRLGLVFGALTLTACAQSLDSDRIAQTIQQSVIQQGGVSLRTVTCPKRIKPEAGQTFECIGETDTGYTFTIPVKQDDDRGNVTWDVPNAKGLLNLAKFEPLVQEAVTSEIGSRPLIRCGGLYKAVKPGQTFECAVVVRQPEPQPKATKLKTVPVKPSKPDTIRVAIDSEGNVNWQRVVAGIPSPSLSSGKETSAPGKGPAASAVKATPPANDTTPIPSADSFDR